MKDIEKLLVSIVVGLRGLFFFFFAVETHSRTQGTRSCRILSELAGCISLYSLPHELEPVSSGSVSLATGPTVVAEGRRQQSGEGRPSVHSF